jgi:hypothetical protein
MTIDTAALIELLRKTARETLAFAPEHIPQSLYSIAADALAHLSAEVARFRTRMLLFENALGHIRWIKDCGIDSVTDAGLLHNHADAERDAMYEIAGKVLAGLPCCDDGRAALGEAHEQEAK